MENNTDNDISLKIEPTINMLKVIKQRSNPESNGSIEVRSYNTEIRNPVTICIDVDGKANAFLTVLVPPKRSIDCIMLEYEEDQCIDVLKYFNLIWDRHKTDVLLDTKKP